MIKPLGDNVLIKQKEFNKTTSGIILSTKKNENSQLAEVIEIGDQESSIVNKGDNIIFSRYVGTEVKYDGQDYMLIKQSDILATF